MTVPLSSELKSDGAPVRPKLLEENLIAFHDNGRTRRHFQSCLSSPLCLFILWSERRERNPVRLSRLEVRHASQMRG
jgi:hypothetical protein